MLLTLLLAPVAAVAGKPMVKVKLTTTGDIWVGQKTVVVVKLYSPTYFSGVPRFDLPEVSGLIMMKVPGRPVVGSEQFGDDTYSVQHHEFFVYPQRVGKVTLPPFDVQFGVAGTGAAKSTRHVLNTRQLQFTARMPAGAEQLQTLISAHKLDVREHWRAIPENPVVGDAFSRTISFRAPDIPGMAFPPIPPMRVPGLAIYPGPAQVHDAVSRGDLTGERVETITYLCEKPGEVTIPALVFHWWDLSTRQLRRVEFPAVNLTVVPDPDIIEPLVAALASTQEENGRSAVLIVAGVSMVILLFLFFVRKRVLTTWRHYHKRQKVVESKAFSQLIVSCRGQDPALVLQTFWLWMVCLPPGSRVATLGELAERFPEPQLIDDLQRLEQAIIGPRQEWCGVALVRSLKKLRKSIFCERRRTLKRPLPDLNPHSQDDFSL
jgi:hypothetical protein